VYSVAQSFEYPPEDPFIYFGELDPSEQGDVILALSEACSDKRSLIRQLVASRPPRERRELRHSLSSLYPAGTNGLPYNSRVLNPVQRRSILYLSLHADPPAGRTELASLFGVGQQRVSQILGAHGCSRTDKQLLDQFRAATPEELRDHWKVQADLDRLLEYRAGKRTASPLTPRFMQPAEPADLAGRWSAYGRSFAVYERDRLFYFLIDAPDEEESGPRNSARQALDECAAACRDEAWANSNGDPAWWRERYREDPLQRMNLKNVIRVDG
jgi:hypothetical protein